MRKANLCIVTPTLSHGGLERVVSELANYAVSEFYDVTIICLIKSKDYYNLDKRVKVYRPDFLYKKGLLNKIKTLFFLVNKLIKIKPDSVLGFSESFNPLTVFSARVTFNKVYISDRSSPDLYLRSTVNFFRKILYPFAHGMIAQTEKAKNILKYKKYNKNITVISNPLRKINDKYPKKYQDIIISVGRLVPSKNFTHLIDIFHSLRNKGDWKLVILGDGPERNILQNKIDFLGINNIVELKGIVEDVDEYFSQASIFAFTSLSEGFPNALNEAMAFPLACISYDCTAGPAEIIKHKVNGLLIPLNDSDLFKRELQELIDNRDLIKKYRNNSLLNRRIYHPDRTSKKYLEFIVDSEA